ncbi:MAG: glycoside hydrolase family protein [Acidobacteriia bacterium]|nr:glycoside hydrolase family protein [Terriglobia bacterium]
MDLSAAAARLRKFEGSVSHMYRCTGGEVTVGVGHAMAAAADAARLVWEIDGVAATAEQAQADFQKVAAAQKGLVASAYAGLTQCRMSDDAISGVLEADLQAFEAQLAAALPRWSSYPEPVQEALFDMAFNLGLGGLKKFPRLLAAVNAGDWTTAAAQCHRQGIGETRNQETAALFLQAAS